MERRHIGGISEWVPVFDSLQNMLWWHDTIIVGRVSGVLQPFDPRPGYLGSTPPAYSDVATVEQDAWTRPPGNLFTVYAVNVMRVIGPSRAKAGDTVAILQPGGVFEGVAYEDADDPMIEVGSTYLVFLRSWDISIPHPWGGAFSSPPFGRFPLDAAGRTQAVNSRWAREAAVAAIAGLTVDEAAAKIEATSRLPTPPPYTPPICSTVTRSPTLTVTPAVTGNTLWLTPSATPTVTDTPTAGPSPTPTITPTPTPTATASTPLPTATSTPTATPPLPGCPP